MQEVAAYQPAGGVVVQTIGGVCVQPTGGLITLPIIGVDKQPSGGAVRQMIDFAVNF